MRKLNKIMSLILLLSFVSVIQVYPFEYNKYALRPAIVSSNENKPNRLSVLLKRLRIRLYGYTEQERIDAFRLTSQMVEEIFDAIPEPQNEISLFWNKELKILVVLNRENNQEIRINPGLLEKLDFYNRLKRKPYAGSLIFNKENDSQEFITLVLMEEMGFKISQRERDEVLVSDLARKMYEVLRYDQAIICDPKKGQEYFGVDIASEKLRGYTKIAPLLVLRLRLFERIRRRGDEKLYFALPRHLQSNEAGSVNFLKSEIKKALGISYNEVPSLFMGRSRQSL